MPRTGTQVFERMACKLATLVLATMVCAAGAHADDTGAPTYTFSGFGTLGLVHSSENQADYTDSVFKPNGAGYTHNWSTDVDSRLGMQLTANASPKFSAVLQVIAQQRYNNSYTPTVEWANIKYAFTPDFSVRLGRIAMSTYLVGDYRRVGYSIPWIRPPSEVYSIMPVSNNDGVDASYRVHFGEVTNTLQALYGNDKINTPNTSIAATAKNNRGLFDTLEYGPATLRLSYLLSNLSVGSTDALFDGFRQFGPQGVAIADNYLFEGRPISFLALGASYDPGNWFVMGETMEARLNSFLGDVNGWYLSSGYRYGNFTPYATYSRSKKVSNTSDPGLDLTLPPASFAPAAAAGLNGALNFLLRATTATTVTIGSRWDFRKNADFKLQYEHVDLDTNSTGPLINLQPGYLPGGKINVISATVDFVF